MTDVSFPNRSYDVRFWPLQHFAEIATFFLLLFITIRLPAIGKLMTLGVLVMLALIVLSNRMMVGRLLRWWPLLLAPLLAMLSFFWSDAPAVSGRYGAQFFITATAGVLIARILSPSRFLTILFLAMLTFCLLSIAFGRSSLGVFVGLVGSKNQMSYLAYVLLFSAVGVMFDRHAPRQVRILTPIGIGLGGFFVATTASATAYMITVVSVVMFIGLTILHKLRPGGRAGLIVAAALILSPLLFILPEIEAAINDFIVNVLHKDLGLTGREYLWSRAAELIAQKPALGYGFQGFWMGGSREAVTLLREFAQTDGRVFNFHSTYYQFAVDTGLIGLAVLIVTIAAALYGYVRRYIVAPTVMMSFFFSMFALQLGRSATEVLLVPFNSGTLLFFICLTYAFWSPRSDWGPEEAPAVQPPPVYPYPVPHGPPYSVPLRPPAASGPSS